MAKRLRFFFSPHGQVLDQYVLNDVKELMSKKNSAHLMLIAGRYEGMDARVEQEYADLIISVGNFVLLGGDLPAMLFLEGFIRLIPGVVGNQQSVENDSFYGPLLDYPEYCLPIVWKEKRVPDIVRSGNHNAIAQWRLEQSVERTISGKFCWARRFQLNATHKKMFLSKIPSHYVVLMHADVLVGKEKLVGNTSVTSIDIHDIARSAMTYGIKNVFIVTPLKDQQAIVARFLEFWQEGDGVTYNNNRHEALSRVRIVSTYDEVISFISAHDCAMPLLIATSASKSLIHNKVIGYEQQWVVWQHQRPVVIMLCTGQGLAPVCFDKADYHLLPLEGLTEYKHLSVRSAAAIIFDRWLGLCFSADNKK